MGGVSGGIFQMGVRSDFCRAVGKRIFPEGTTVGNFYKYILPTTKKNFILKSI